ncbi:uncharacterized protein LOC119741068 [Patiria miniata]|uniref:G-protein coupled receptors family 2 profile 2 domain-containing protein n=1 Tax=Patiria miniata TaxID=46514 RepID=A0A914BB32_PATMI|nr:uncharacterized protein LOC119741068 [Patiria miniata]
MANIIKFIALLNVLLYAAHKKSGIHVRAQDEPPADASTNTMSATPTSSDTGTDSPPDQHDWLTTIEFAGTSVGLCTERHLCSSLGCGFQSYFSPNSTAGALCQCDPVCTFFNDCCVDYEDTCMSSVANEERPASQRLHVSSLTLTDFTCYFESSRKLEGYYVISACPHDYPTVNDYVRQRCEQGDSDDFLTGLPVCGVKNDFPYSNVYCALSWQEATSDLEPWTVTVDCWDKFVKDQAFRLLSNSTSRETLETIRDELGCSLLRQPPESAGSVLRLCHYNLIAECPVGHPLAQACTSYTALSATNYYLTGITLYKNPHCVICNEEERILKTDCSLHYPTLVTTRDDPRPPIPPAPAPDNPGPPPISIVFDFRSGGNVKVLSQDSVVVEEVQVTCSTNEVYDPFLSRCRKLSCADGYVLEGERCIRLLTIPHGQEMVAYVHVSVCTEPLSSIDILEEIIKGCLVELANVNASQFQPSTIESALATSGNCPEQLGKRHVFASMVQFDRETFLAFHLQLLATEGQTFCPEYLQPTPNTYVEVIYHDASLALARCTGRWENASVDDSPINGNLTIQRETLKLQEASGVFLLSSDVQICTNPDLSCLLETFNSSLFRPTDDDDVLVYIPTDTVFTRDEYIETPDGEIKVCSFNEQNGTRNVTQTFTFFQYSLPQQILNLVANIVSMLAAVVTLVTFCVFKELRNRTTGPIMNFTAALFLAQFLLLLSGAATQNAAACTLVALLAHYFLLVSVMWTGVLAFILNRTFTVWHVQRGKTGISLPSISFAWGVPFLVALPCLILHLCRCTDFPLWYGNEHVCWVGDGYVSMVVVGVPIGLVVLTNIVLFSLTVCGIRKTKRETRNVLGNKTEVQQVKEELIIYIKIATLMGFTWIFGFAAAISDVIALWYVFILLNASQGVHIFLSFICNKKVWRLWLKAFQSRCGRRYARADGGSKEASRNTKTLENVNTATTNV